MSTPTATRRDLYQHVTDAIVTQLEAGTVPWRRPWDPTVGQPRNAFTSRPYSGINSVLLGLEPYNDPRWGTYKQIAEHGGQVRKGEHGSLVVFYKPIDKRPSGDDDTTAATEKNERRRYLLLKSYTVFNTTQADGLDLPDLDTATVDRVEPLAAADAVLTGYNNPPSVRHNSTSATYNPAADAVATPPIEAFKSAEAFYLCLWHELAHSSGHPDRLNRPDLTAGRFGDRAYAREELTAEVTSAMIAARTGIVAPDIENTAAYIAGWLTALHDDTHLVVIAAGRAQKAADHILGVSEDGELMAPTHQHRSTAASFGHEPKAGVATE